MESHVMLRKEWRHCTRATHPPPDRRPTTTFPLRSAGFSDGLPRRAGCRHPARMGNRDRIPDRWSIHGPHCRAETRRSTRSASASRRRGKQPKVRARVLVTTGGAKRLRPTSGRPPTRRTARKLTRPSSCRSGSTPAPTACPTASRVSTRPPTVRLAFYACYVTRLCLTWRSLPRSWPRCLLDVGWRVGLRPCVPLVRCLWRWVALVRGCPSVLVAGPLVQCAVVAQALRGLGSASRRHAGRLSRSRCRARGLAACSTSGGALGFAPAYRSSAAFGGGSPSFGGVRRCLSLGRLCSVLW